MKIKVKDTTDVLDVKFDDGKAITSGKLGGNCLTRVWEGFGRYDVVRIYEVYTDPYGSGGWEMIAEITTDGAIQLGGLLEFDTEGLSVERSLDGGLPIYKFKRLERNWDSQYLTTDEMRFASDKEALEYAEKYRNLYKAVVAPDGRYIKGKELL